MVNMSSCVLRLLGYEGADWRHQLPPWGTAVAPREQIQFEVAPQVLRSQAVIAHFKVIHPDGNVLPHYYLLAIGTDRVGCPDRDAMPVPEIQELHLTQDDIVLRNAI